MRKASGKLAGWRQLVVAALTLVTLAWATDKGPDAGQYTATDNTVYSFVDPAGAGGSASVLAGIDDGVALLTLPFSFQFYGKSYTMLCASSNGVVYFVTDANTCTSQVDFTNTDLTSTAGPGDLPALAPFWTDLSFQTPGAGAVYYQVVGTAGSRQFVIEWYNAYTATSPSPVTFEAILSERSNNILFQYQTVDPTKGALATVGIRDAGGSTNNRQIQWSFDAGVLAASGAILFTAPKGAFSGCDLNQDGSTNVVDVQLIIDEALGTKPAVDDLNQDHVVDVIDVQIEINAALGLGCTAK